MINQIRIRRVDIDDSEFDTLLALDRQILPDAPDPAGQTEWWGAYTTSGDLVAYAGGIPGFLGTAKYYLSRSGVIPEARGQGLQSRLIRARVQSARRHGCTHAITYTAPDNPASANSLIKCGFRCYNPEFAWSGRDWVYWQRVLITPTP